MGKTRPDIVRMRLKGSSESVAKLLKMIAPLLQNDQYCKIGRAIEVGSDRRDRKPAAESHIMVPYDVLANVFKNQSINNTVGETTTEEKQDESA